MIRLIQRRLIIPRGDTGSFTIPTLGPIDETDIAVFSIFSQMTHKVIFSKYGIFENNLIKINFSHADTVNLKPGKYVWDIRIYKNPQFIDEVLIGGDEIHSYYAGFNLPVCEIKETAAMYLCGHDDTVLTPNEFDLINATIDEVKDIAARAENSVARYPIIQNNYWYVWSPEKEGYINTKIRANGDNTVISIELLDENTVKATFSDGSSQIIPLSGTEVLIPEEELIYDAGSIDDDIYDAGNIDETIITNQDLILDGGSLEGDG